MSSSVPGEICIVLGGVFNTAFALFHLAFWRFFAWRRELAQLSFINRQIMQILNLCLTFVLLVFAYLSFLHTAELLSTALGRALSGFIALFWGLRALEQIIFFGLRRAVSAGLFAMLVAGSLLYAYPLLGRGI